MIDLGRWNVPPAWRLVAVGVVALLLHEAQLAGGSECTGDCNSDASVTVNELVAGVSMALGNLPVGECSSLDRNRDQAVGVDELVAATGNALTECPPTETPTSTPPPTATDVPLPTSTSTPTATPIPDDQVPPTMPAALLAWLQAGTYLGWRADPQRHQTLGPHGFEVRTFFNDAVVRSLEAGDAPHPAGSALVKELYSGDRVVNWAVMVKLQAESDRGNGWYWYEGVGLQGKGLSICTSCHIGPAYNGLTGRDFVFSPLPPP